MNHQQYLWKLVPFEPCHNMLDCFIYISISHLNTRVNLIALTKFDCPKYAIIVGKNFLSRQKPFLGVLRNCYSNIHNFFYIHAILCLRNTCVPWKVKFYINEIKYMFRIQKCSIPIFISFLPLNAQKFDQNIIGLYIKFSILLRPRKYVCL